MIKLKHILSEGMSQRDIMEIVNKVYPQIVKDLGGSACKVEVHNNIYKRLDAVGIEGMEAINEGGGIGTTMNINNPIISSEFVEEELPELIAEAIRKGANFGMS